MKQPDTAALRERLANYTPEDELEQDKWELDGLLLEVNCLIAELRNLLKEINALKEELHGIHSSLKHTAQRERTAFNALNAARDSADNIVDGILQRHYKSGTKYCDPCQNRHGRTGEGQPIHSRPHQGRRRTVGTAQHQNGQTPSKKQ